MSGFSDRIDNVAEEANWRNRKVDRTAVSFAEMTGPDDALEYWLEKSVEERLDALEMARRICYGEAAATARLQRILEVAELT